MTRAAREGFAAEDPVGRAGLGIFGTRAPYRPRAGVGVRRPGLAAVAALAALLAAAAFPRTARAFAENVRHGYVNCIACHASPTGGGALTAYGRELSRELMSTWGREGEQKWMYAYEPSTRLALGGDVRSAYSYVDNTAIRQGKWYFMQADLEGYANVLPEGGSRSLWVGGSVGVEKKVQDLDQYDFISRRHWLNYRPSDELSIRLGKFQTGYGLNVPDHVAFFRRLTGRDQGTETYNAEFAWIGENWNAIATASFGRPDDLSRRTAERGGALNASYAFWNRNRVGVSYYRGESDVARRQLAGPYAMLGLTERLYVLSEIDWQWISDKSRDDEQRGFVTYARVGYEAYKGVIPYVLHEFNALNENAWSNRTDGFGVGLQWLPRPHLEANVLFQKRRTPSLAAGYVDYAYLMLHFYP